MKPWQWAVAGLVGALLLAGAGLGAGYWIRTSSQQSFDAWRKGAEQLAQAGAAAQSAHDDALLASVGALLASSAAQAQQGRRRDTVIQIDSGAVAEARRILAGAQTALDSLRRFPPVVAAQDTQIHDLTGARDRWREAFGGQAQANATLLALHVSDTLFRARLLAHLDSTPKAPRGAFGLFLTRPKPGVITSYSARHGWDARAVLCWGICQ